MAGHSGQFTPGCYLLDVIHTTLAGIEPTTFRLLVRRATSIGYRYDNVEYTRDCVVAEQRRQKVSISGCGRTIASRGGRETAAWATGRQRRVVINFAFLSNSLTQLPLGQKLSKIQTKIYRCKYNMWTDTINFRCRAQAKNRIRPTA